nr:hypothetical protein StreXyl84_64580 [Streptomyces sp. Xyl84]
MAGSFFLDELCLAVITASFRTQADSVLSSMAVVASARTSTQRVPAHRALVETRHILLAQGSARVRVLRASAPADVLLAHGRHSPVGGSHAVLQGNAQVTYAYFWCVAVPAVAASPHADR